MGIRHNTYTNRVYMYMYIKWVFRQHFVNGSEVCLFGPFLTSVQSFGTTRPDHISTTGSDIGVRECTKQGRVRSLVEGTINDQRTDFVVQNQSNRFYDINPQRVYKNVVTVPKSVREL